MKDKKLDKLEELNAEAMAELRAYREEAQAAKHAADCKRHWAVDQDLVRFDKAIARMRKDLLIINKMGHKYGIVREQTSDPFDYAHNDTIPVESKIRDLNANWRRRIDRARYDDK